MTNMSRRTPFFNPFLGALTLLFVVTFLFVSQVLADYSWENVPAGYGLAWSDEFNGATGSGPDTTVWTYDTGTGQPNHELENYTNSRNNSVVLADPKAVDGKALAIIALDPGGNNDQMGSYTSARIDTADKKTFTYGYMEARVRMPYGQGIWPAFWMLGNNINHGVGWPACDEIDIMENIGNAGDQATNHMSLHDGSDVTTFLPLPGGQLYHNAYHTFAAKWVSNQIQFFVDGNLMATDTPANLNNNFAFNNNPNFFLLNVATGGDWPGNPDGSTSFPQTMLVDYVRAYQTGFATPTPVVQSAWRVRCGGDSYTDSQGNVWAADTHFTGGWPAANNGTAVSGALPGPGDQTLYQWERYGNTTGGTTLNYAFNVPSGNYQVTLKFAEDYWTAAGQRQFNYSINGTTEATNFDIFAAAGGAFKAIDKVYSNITPNSNGQIVIQLAPGAADNAKIDAIQIIQTAGNPTSTPTRTSTPSFTPTQVTQSTWRVVTGGAAYTDSQGHAWSADANFTGGTAAAPSTNTITGSLPSSTDQALYRSQRYGSPFTYSFAVPAGSYQVTMKFAETYWTAAGQRVFSASLNGTQVLTNFDILKTAGAANKALDEVFNNISPLGGFITIQLGPASVDNAMVDAIQIIPQPNLTPTNSFTATASNTPTRTPTSANTATFTSTSTASFTKSATPTSTSTPTGFTAAAGGAWVNEPFANQTGDFAASFDATISASPNNAVVALSNGAQTAYTSFAALVRFNTLGDIDAYDANSGGYAASTTVPFTAGTTYHFTFQVHMAAQTYDILVSQGGGASQLIGTGFKFRVAASSLNNYGLFVNAGGSGNLTVDHFTIAFPSTATSTSTRTSTNSPTVTNTFTVTATGTSSFTPTDSMTSTATPTSTSTATFTFTVTSTNTRTSTFTSTVTSTSTATPVGQTTWRLVAGGPAHTDCQGNVWSADSNFTGGTAATSTNAITGALPCSTDGALYQDQRWGSPFTYSFPVPAGSYQVTLKFAETYWTAAGQRVFNVSINGSTVLTNLDIFATSGAANKSVDKIFNNIAAVNGAISIQFGPASVDNALVDSIQVIPQSIAPPTATFTNTSSPTRTFTPAPVAATHLVGYLPDYGGSFATFANTLNWNKMTHLNLAFVNPPTCNGGCGSGSNMNFSLGQSDANIAALVNAAHAHGVKVLASIGGAGGDAQIVQFYNAGLSSQLVASLNNYVTAHNLDGVDLDIEQPNNVGANFTTFVNACMNTFHPQGKLVTAAVAQYITQGNMSTSTLLQFDFVNVMVYDNLSLCQQAVAYYTSVGEPKNKIVLGVPFFGSGGGQEPTWASIVAAYPNAGSSNSVSGGPLLGGASINYVGYSEMAQETQLGAQYGGVMIWDLSQDAPAPNSLLTIIQNNLPVGTPVPTPTPVVASTWRVVSGGSAYTDSQGNVWSADKNFSGGTAAVTTSTITGALPASTDQALYRSQRYGNPFTYSFNVPAGSYQVTLKFAETYWTTAGKRVFNVLIDGTQVLTNLDIFSTAGGQNKAIDEVFNNIAPSGGVITIQLGPASADNGMVSAIQIIPQSLAKAVKGSEAPDRTTPTLTPTPSVTSTPVLPLVQVWPNLSQSGEPILFKVNSDPGSEAQLSIYTVMGEQIVQTSFAEDGRSGYLWRLQNRSGSPVASGLYVYVLRFKQQGQDALYRGKVSVIR